MNCINLKQKINRTLFCKKLNKQIIYKECSNCPYKEYKTQECKSKKNKTHEYKKMRLKSKSLANLEKDRFSVFSDNTKKCYFCENAKDLTWHEIFAGRNRQNSMKFGLCLRMCMSCHEKYQENLTFNIYWHENAQIYFENNIGTHDDFINIFRKNYLK